MVLGNSEKLQHLSTEKPSWNKSGVYLALLPCCNSWGRQLGSGALQQLMIYTVLAAEPTNQEDLLIFKALVYNARNSESLWVLAAFRLQLWILSAKTKSLSHSCSPRMSRRRLALLCFVSLFFLFFF